ncbi:hypothetical protein JNUCC77_13675 (plasmid) [Enterococcus alishanensis]
MPRENNLKMQQIEWLDEVIKRLVSFKSDILTGKVIVESAYFDTSSRVETKSSIENENIRLDIDYVEPK